MRSLLRAACVLGVCPALGCVLLIREPEAYREDVVELVSAGEKQIVACYEQSLAERQRSLETTEREVQGPYADIGPTVKERLGREQGLVVVRFQVAAGTGELSDPRVDEQQTTAPALAVECVLASLDGLVLEAPDHKDADVTLAWKLQLGTPKAKVVAEREPSSDGEQRPLE